MTLAQQEGADFLTAFRQIDSCEDKDRIISSFLAGRLTYEDAAVKLGVKPGDVFEYLKNALMNYENRDLATATDHDLLLELRRLLMPLRRYVKDFSGMPASGKNAASLTSMTREIRGLIRDAIELDKKIKESERSEVQDLTAYLEAVSAFMATDLCSQCQGKVLSFLQRKGRPEAQDVEFEVVEKGTPHE